MEKPDKPVRLTYYTKDALTCPVCGAKIHKEEILSGGGRLMAGKLSEELHRSYEPTKKYGEVYPLIYNIVVCNTCYFASFPIDFNASMKEENAYSLRAKEEEREQLIFPLFPGLDFTKQRTLNEGVASYLLAMFCYENGTHSPAPTFRQGLCALRAAWLSQYLDIKHPDQNYDYLATMLYRKAAFYYRRALELDAEGIEACSKIAYMGPDADNNYGFDGMQYLAGLLEFKYGVRNDPIMRISALDNACKVLSRIVGMGKSSRAKPSAIIDYARDAYMAMKAEQKKLQEEHQIEAS